MVAKQSCVEIAPEDALRIAKEAIEKKFGKPYHDRYLPYLTTALPEGGYIVTGSSLATEAKAATMAGQLGPGHFVSVRGGGAPQAIICPNGNIRTIIIQR